MKKFGMIMVLMMASMGAYAGTNFDDGTKGENGPMMKINEVTGVWSTNRFTYDKDMNLVFCHENSKWNYNVNSCEVNGKNAWRTMENVAPPGKKVVGFKQVYIRGERFIEIYWK